MVSLAVVSAQQPAERPAFEVVSIKRNPGPGGGSSFRNRPDGGITMINMPVRQLIAVAYSVDIVGLPEWATRETYDVLAVGGRPGATGEERKAMLRVMLADRFQLVAHFEDREYDAYDLVLAREDGRPGPGLTPVDVDCAALEAERQAAFDAGEPLPLPVPGSAPLPACASRSASGRLEGQITMTQLARFLRILGFRDVRSIADKTGLTGSYAVRMDFDPASLRSGPDVLPSADSRPSLVTALQEQLGLRLVPSRTSLPTLIIDRLERPSEN
jgi:uncharacterized protein (TIGR03435 family)